MVCESSCVSSGFVFRSLCSSTLLRLIGNAHNVNEHLYPTHTKNWLGHALVDISCYPIEPTSSNDNDNDPDVVSSSILITSARSWDGEDIHRFLVNHPHPKRIVSKVIWNDRTTTLL
jgi:hypothetical protein